MEPKPFLWKNQKGNDLRDFTCGTISHQNRLLDFWSKHEEEQKWNNIAAMEITPVQPMKWNGLIFHHAGYLEPHESRSKRGRKEFYSCQNFTSTTVLCFSLTCSINILLQLSKFIRSLRLVKSLSNWKPVTNTYHRGLDFFSDSTERNALPRIPWKDRLPSCSCESAGSREQCLPLMNSTWSVLGGLGPKPGASMALTLGKLSLVGGVGVGGGCASSQRPQCPGSLALASDSTKWRRSCFLVSSHHPSASEERQSTGYSWFTVLC